jgi:hypothetical protein
VSLIIAWTLLASSVGSAASKSLANGSTNEIDKACERSITLCLSALDKQRELAEKDAKLIEALTKQRNDAIENRENGKLMTILESAIVGIALGVILTRGLR